MKTDGSQMHVKRGIAVFAGGRGVPSRCLDALVSAGLPVLALLDFGAVPAAVDGIGSRLVVFEPSPNHLVNYELSRAINDLSGVDLWFVHDRPLDGTEMLSISHLGGVLDIRDADAVRAFVAGQTEQPAMAHLSAPEGSLALDARRRSARIGDNVVALTRTEFDLLSLLLEQPGEVVMRRELIAGVWGANWFGAPNLLDTHLSRVRRKLQQINFDGRIETVRGLGFSIVTDTPNRLTVVANG